MNTSQRPVLHRNTNTLNNIRNMYPGMRFLGYINGFTSLYQRAHRHITR